MCVRMAFDSGTRTPFWVCLGLWACVLGWDPGLGQSIQEIRFQPFTVEAGFVPSTVYAVLEDDQGFIWLGTESGLMRYDGYTLRAFKIQSVDPAGISGNLVRGLFQDSRLKIWICTEHGLNLFDPDTDLFTHYLHEPENPKSLSDNGVYCAIEGPMGRIWVGTYYGGLNCLDPDTGEFTHYRMADETTPGMLSDKVRVLLLDRDGFLWAGTGGGLNRIDPQTGKITGYVHRANVLDGLTHNDVRGLCQDDDGGLWIATTHGLNHLDPVTGRFRHYLHDRRDATSLSDNWINVVAVGASGLIMLGTKEGGLNFLDAETGKFASFQHDRYSDDSISGDNILTVYPDRSGLVWVGTYLSGLNYFQVAPKPFSVHRYHPEKPNSLSNNQIRGVYEDRDGGVWVGTLDGLNCLNRETRTFRRYQVDPKDSSSIPERQITAISQDTLGRMWLGTYFGGLIIFDPEKEAFERWIHEDQDPASLSHDVINALLRDRDGRMWVGTRGGLDRFDDDGFTHFAEVLPKGPTQVSGEVRTIFQDRSGVFWIGFDGQGLCRFVPGDGRPAMYRHDPQRDGTLSHDYVTAICEDTSGALWVGTRAGLNRFDSANGRFTLFDEEDGFPNGMIRGVVESRPGELWISTGCGLVRFCPRDMDICVFDASDGLQANEFVVGAYCRCGDGRLYFGGVNGLNGFFPDQIVENRRHAPVVITSFQVFGREHHLDRPIRHTSEIVLSHEENFFSFEFAALDFVAPRENQYAYMLEGLDKDWIHAGTRRFASYTDVDSGDYVFRVKGTNSDGFWSDREASVALRIVPPFWTTRWFVAVSLMTLALMVMGAYRFKTHSIRVQKERLEREVAQRTQALFETQQKLMESAHAAGMAEVSTGVIHNIGNILNSVNISAENIAHILRRSQLGALFKANEILEKNIDHIVDYLTHDRKGMLLLKFYLNVGRVLKDERTQITRETQELNEKVQLIKEAIVTQQSYAKATFHSEEVSICRLIDDALKLQAASLEKRQIQIVREYRDHPVCFIPRLKLIHIFTNLIKNAREAMDEVGEQHRVLTIEVWSQDDNTCVSVQDTGCGIEPQHLKRIFGFGFSTKRDGHGFGLHSSANAIAELGGSIRAFSDGPGTGSRFELTIPRRVASNPGDA